MGFTKTAEGRVFFQNADNDDGPAGKKAISAANKPAAAKSEPVSKPAPILPKDNTQVQILMLLKSLNAKLKNSKDDQSALKQELAQYKKTLKTLEDKTSAHEGNYIDLEQKLARKQSETSKKATRVETGLKNTLKQLAEAKALVEELEKKTESIDEIKTTVAARSKTDKAIEDKQKSLEESHKSLTETQKTLEAAQKKQGEKMVSQVAAYVDLTKRVSEAEAREEALENKLEDVTSEYLKLDRKIDKALEDRARILRKVERIENAVLETRDALNAKAMVLLTSNGAVGGVSLPQIEDSPLANADPMAIGRRLEEENLLPWWRKPLRLQTPALVLLVFTCLLAGWVFSTLWAPKPQTYIPMQEQTPTVRLDLNPQTESFSSIGEEVQSYDGVSVDTADAVIAEPLEERTVTADAQPAQEDAVGITIHKGSEEIETFAKKNTTTDNAQDNQNTLDIMNIENEDEMLRIMEQDPDALAAELNKLEPSSLTDGDMAAPQNESITIAKATPVEPVQTQVTQSPTPVKADAQAVKAEYIASLKQRIQPDQSLSEVAKKIEKQAFQAVPEAQHDMGAIYVAGHGAIAQNLNRAVFWFTEAANNGVSNAKYNLGVLYHQGLGVDKSLSKAMSLYTEAADLGHAEAQYNLGIAYIEGIGVPYDPRRATQYFKQAANQGVIEAAYNLGLIYENGLLGKAQPEDALLWYQTAADSGSPEANAALDQLSSALGMTLDDVANLVESLKEQRRAEQGANASEDGFILSQIQNELMRRGLYPGPVDGKNGPMTRSAIEAFQRAADLDINGQPSRELLRYLKASGQYSNN